MSAGAGGSAATLGGRAIARPIVLPLPSRPFVLVTVLFLGLSFQMLTFTGRLADGELGSGPAL